jgi:ABC-type transport system involved in cytochrome bd biosynthesis fused ATPase/permease subunit
LAEALDAIPVSGFGRDLTIENVSFAYDADRGKVLDQIDLRWKRARPWASSGRRVPGKPP